MTSSPRPATVSVLAAILLAIASVAWPAPALSQTGRRAAKVHHDKAVNHYNMGRFEEAIDEFQKAYDAEPHATLLFNIAKAHGRLGNSERAIFFYKRYLQMAPQAKDAEDVRERIREFEAQLAKPQNESPVVSTPSPPVVSPPPPEPVRPPAKEISGPSGAQASPAPEREQPPTVAAASSQGGSETLRLSAEGGVAFPSLSGERGDAVQGATLFAGRISAEYVFALSPAQIDVGLAGTFSPLAYEDRESQKRTSYLVGALLTASLRYPLGGRLSLGFSLGGGLVWWTGLRDGHPFTQTRAELGAVAMPSVRASGGILWRLGERAFVGLMPAFTFSKTSGDQLRDDVSSIRRLEIGATVGLAI